MRFSPPLDATNLLLSSSQREMPELLPRRVTTILVVDDNPDNALLMRELLTSRGYEVVVALQVE